MTKKEFKKRFIIGFLSSWASNHYEEFCMTGRQEALSDPPIEDANHLADETWEKYLEWQQTHL